MKSWRGHLARYLFAYLVAAAAAGGSGRPEFPPLPRGAGGLLGGPGLPPGAPQGLRGSKRLLRRDLLARIDALGEEMAVLSTRLFASDEAREAMTAFLSRGK